jgi:CPA2 family monovalent cation:H+ antiporter-2
MEVVLPLFLLVFAAFLGGFAARALKLPPLLGYIVGGLIFGTIVPPSVRNIARLSEFGTILLLFSIGLELSISRLVKFFKIAVVGAMVQILVVTALLYLGLTAIGIESVAALVLAGGFSLSSTALVVKILGDRGELDTLHGGVMFGWLLVQDLAVVPMMVILPLLGTETGILGGLGMSLIKALFVVGVTIYMGKSIIPQIIHKIALANSRELLALSSVALATGVAVITFLFGISPALGAFLAGIAISETQEHHAVFAEVRPLRDLFVALFFVSIGFVINPLLLVPRLGLIVAIALGVMILKALIVFLIGLVFKFRGRSAIATSLGLSQIGEFALVIFSAALALGKISADNASLGIGVAVVTLLISPFLFKIATPLWRKLKNISPIFSSGQKVFLEKEKLENHIIICGYGRVGSWVGKALMEFNIPFIVVEYNEAIASDLKDKGINVVYGDPGETEIMDLAGLSKARVLVLAIPDAVAQENLITYAQTTAPNLKIISRVHEGVDIEELKTLGVDKIVQPEFEGGVAIVRSIFSSMGKEKGEVANIIKKMRISHAKS